MKTNYDRDAKYLRITIHDNDFMNELEIVGEILSKLFWAADRYPEEEELDHLKTYIQTLLFSIVNTNNIMPHSVHWEHVENKMELFKPELELVHYLDIPEWNNRENIYIPMFDYGRILIR